MPDLTTEVYYHCAGCEGFRTEVTGSTGTVYKVCWDNYSHKNRSNVQYDYSCTCMAYKTKKGYCKHIREVIVSGKHCKWMQFIDGGEVVRKDGETFCPECGSPAHAQRHAV